jgi:hypothetical protein
MEPVRKIISKFRLASILVIAFAIIFFAACQENEEPVIPGLPEVSFTAGPEGGYFNALDGNVQFYFPKDALAENVSFLVKEGPEDEEGDFVIQSILIEPSYLEFMKPASIALRYDGCLANGKDPCKAECLALYYFENDKAFDVRRPQDMVWIEKCCLNTMDRCIETKIYSGGVFAIGEASMDLTKH